MTEQLSELTIITACIAFYIILYIIVFFIVKKVTKSDLKSKQSLFKRATLVALTVYVLTLPFAYFILSGEAYEWYYHYKIIKDFEESTEVLTLDEAKSTLVFDEEKIDGLRAPKGAKPKSDYDEPTSDVMKYVLDNLEDNHYYWRGYLDTDEGVRVDFYYTDEKKCYGYFIDFSDISKAKQAFSETLSETKITNDGIKIREGDDDNVQEIVALHDNYLLFGSFHDANELFEEFVELCKESW